MDGIETCREIRNIDSLKNVLIAFLTARNEDYSQIAGFDVGADDYITKPIKPRVLISRIKALLRRTLHVSIPASIAIVQHLVLVVGMLGGAIAAREQRLLSLANIGETKLHGRFRAGAKVLTSGIAVVVCAFLCIAATQFVLSERESERFLALGIPIWAVESVLPLGFAAIALRILWNASEKWALRLGAGALALAHPAAHEANIPSSAVTPSRPAPYPALVGTATTGPRAIPPTTLASAPSMPATTMTRSASAMLSISGSRRWTPATPTSVIRSGRKP